MHRGRVLVVLFAVSALSLVVPPAQAKSVQIDCGSDPGLLLDKAGTYTIRTAVNSCSSPVLVEIAHSDVTLSLGGRMLEGHSTNCLEGIHVNADLKRIVIRNGAIAFCDVGIRSESHGPLISRVSSFENDLGLDVKVGRFVRNFVAHSIGTGMTDDSGGSFVGNTIVSTGASGIESNGTKLVERNRVVNAGGTGIAGGSGGRIEDNFVYGNGNRGIILENGRVAGNTAVGNTVHGIEGVGSALVEGNRSIANNNGLVLSSEATARDNVALANNSFGIVAFKKVLANRANGNLAHGVSVGVETVVKDNVASGNVGLGIDAVSSPIGLGTNKASRNNGGVAPQCDPAELCVPDPALDGKQIIFLDCSATHVIDTPGAHVLGASVKDCGGGSAINIKSSGVTLDLKGHRIDGTAAFAAGIIVDDGLTDVVVRNGTVSDYLLGVAAGDTGAVIENVVAAKNYAAGIAAGDGVRVRNNTVVGTINTPSSGVLLNPGATVTGNTIVANNYEGIHFDAGPVTIKNNYIAGNGDGAIAGFGTDGNTITGNTILGSGWVAIRVGDNNRVSGNVIRGSVDYPIEAENNNTIQRNTIVGNSGGINVNANNRITDNVVRSNLGAGIYTESGTIARNKAIGNTGDGIQTGDSVVITDNTAIGNGDNGIDALPAATGSGNVANKNGALDQCVPDGLGC